MPPPDRAALAVFVQDFTDATGLGVTSKPFCFGDSPQLADELAALVRSGRKRATATTIAEFDHEGEPLPTIGQHSVVRRRVGRRPRAAGVQPLHLRVRRVTHDQHSVEVEVPS